MLNMIYFLVQYASVENLYEISLPGNNLQLISCWIPLGSHNEKA